MDRSASIGVVFNQTMLCEREHTTSSKGYFFDDSPFLYPMPILMLQIILIYFTTKILEVLLHPLHPSRTIIQIIAGIIIGPSFVTSNQKVSNILFPPGSRLILNTISGFGFILHLFTLGVKINTSLLKNLGRKSMVIGVTSYLFPIGSTLLIYSFIQKINPPLASEIGEGFLYTVPLTSMTSFIVITSLLTDLNILNSEIGRLAAYTTICADFSGWFTGQLATYSQFAMNPDPIKVPIIVFVVSMLCFYIIMFFGFRPLVIMVVKNTPEGKSIKDTQFFFIIFLVLVVAFFSDTLGIVASAGTFLFGLSLPDGPPLGSSLIQKLDTINSGLLLPMYVALCGLRTDYHNLVGGIPVLVTELMILLVYFNKLVSIIVTSRYFDMPFWDAVTLALIMSCKGIADVGFLEVWFYNQLLSDKIYTLMVFTMVVVSLIVTPLVGYLYDPSMRYITYQRTILHDAKKNNNLHILVCIHCEDNVPPFINLIEATNSTRGRPLSVFVLQLKELTGRAASILVPHHKLTKRSTSDLTKSERIVNAFKYFEKHGQTNVLVEHFLSITPYASMHDDICTIAFDKNVCFALIPYYKRWAIDGSVDHSLMSIKPVNENVLEKAPCSVGLLVDRGQVGDNQHALANQSSYRIALLYIGGADDQEALAYCRRVADNPNVTLKVFFIKPWHQSSQSKYHEDIEESINDFKAIALDNARITYKEDIVSDGVGTTQIIRSLEDDFDLMIVGKHHDPYSPVTLGLTEWGECPELGIIGDILATSDFQFSVLVIQQPQRVGFIDTPLIPRRNLGSGEVLDKSFEKEI